ncbi:hypothetical protein RRG08_064339 [Elysia crispata]|uniref:Uncharacterized protein n=1 Tax=Elysia crispata TaxID=231223 RepID=A0AAE0ZIS9_9GAST|nr:hypothetical protein RRG08_064339 [Elysia crispata]
MHKIKTEDTQAITVGGKSLEVVENFTYLGSAIDHSGGTAADDPAHILARKNSKRGVVEQSRTAPNPGVNNTEKMEMAGAHSQKFKKQHNKTILAVEPSRQTEQGKTTDNMENKFGKGDEGKWSLMEGHYTDGSG